MERFSAPPHKGKRLIDAMLEILEERNYTDIQCHEEFGVGQTWYRDLYSGRRKTASADTVQYIYEILIGKPLLEEKDPAGE